MSLEIAKIQNDALKTVAQSIDQRGNKNNTVDDNEMSLFLTQSTTLLNEGKCTSQEIQAICNTATSPQKETTVELFERLDSINASKNTPEELKKVEQESLKYEIREIQKKINENDKKLKTYEERLAARFISYSTYVNDLHLDRYAFNTLLAVATPFTGGFGIGSIVSLAIPNIIEGAILSGIGIATGGLAVLALGFGPLIAEYISKKNHSSPENQADIRNEYKEAYLEVQKENEKLCSEIAELEKKLRS